jgi:HEPN domain-containing protein
MTDYAVSVRYPDDFYMPSIEEADECLRLAESVREFVRCKLAALLKIPDGANPRELY